MLPVLVRLCSKGEVPGGRVMRGIQHAEPPPRYGPPYRRKASKRRMPADRAPARIDPPPRALIADWTAAVLLVAASPTAPKFSSRAPRVVSQCRVSDTRKPGANPGFFVSVSWSYGVKPIGYTLPGG